MSVAKAEDHELRDEHGPAGLPVPELPSHAARMPGALGLPGAPRWGPLKYGVCTLAQIRCDIEDAMLYVHPTNIPICLIRFP